VFLCDKKNYFFLRATFLRFGAALRFAGFLAAFLFGAALRFAGFLAAFLFGAAFLVTFLFRAGIIDTPSQN